MPTAENRRAPNRLIRESSPYLRQHAYNPVDWYPWCEEALRRARELDRPIFLSIGYSSCHWCHVMERESFENEEIARILNEHFVSIKVDREERPDIDQIYMQAVQALTGSGGWPLSVFLTPDLRPFWGGTYFPPESRWGRPGFRDILLEIAKLWREKRETIEEQASRLFEFLAAAQDFGSPDLPDRRIFARAVEEAARSFDPRFGGFGPAPKFPRAADLLFLLAVCARKGPKAKDVLAMCERTLEGMAKGGIYDQIGGGFHRYSTDERWLVPHFEKMLYDNALLARAYLDAYRLTEKPLYARIARETLDYVLREMTSPEGAFYSATDADSEGKEGAFFVWRPEEIEEVLDPGAAKLVCAYYGVSEEGNFEGGTTVLHVARPLEDAARAAGIDPRRAEEVLQEARARLYEAREKRPKPFRDEKVIASWNGLMISALAHGAQVLGDQKYAEAARKAADFIRGNLREGGGLLHVWKDGEAKIAGFLDDYACVVAAFIDLFETVFAPEDLEEALSLARAAIEKFTDERDEGFYYSAPEHDDLIVRRKDILDSATPAGGAVLAYELHRLERLTGIEDLRRRGEAYLKSVRGAVERMPLAFASTLIALDAYLHPPVEVAVLGPLGSPKGRALLGAVWGTLVPGRVLAAAESPVPERLQALVPLLRGREAIGGEPTAYVCSGYACEAPLGDPEALRELLRARALDRD